MKKFLIIEFIILTFCFGTSFGYAKEVKKIQNCDNVINLPQQSVEDNLPEVDAEQIDGLIRVQPEAKKTTETSEGAFDEQLEQNIFNKDFSKTFATGIIKDIKLTLENSSEYNLLSERGGSTHNLFNNDVSLYGFTGHLRDGTYYCFSMLPFNDVDGYSHFEHRLFEYYMRHDITEHQQITVGQQRTPNTVEGSHSSFGLPVGRRALLARKYSNITAIGSMMSGNWDRFEYQAGLFDTGRFLKNDFDSAPEFAGLMSFKPIKNTQKYGKLKLGGSYNVGNRETSYSVYSGHAIYTYKKLYTDFEYAYANGYNSRVNSGDKSNGYYYTVIYELTPKIKPFCRFDTLNANRALPGHKIAEYTLGMHYYLKGEKARFTLSYVHADNQDTMDSNRLFSQLEIIL